MPRDIRLALRIRGDHYQWRITPEDAPRHKRHNKRTEGGATYNFLGYTFVNNKYCHTRNYSISYSK